MLKANQKNSAVESESESFQTAQYLLRESIVLLTHLSFIRRDGVARVLGHLSGGVPDGRTNLLRILRVGDYLSSFLGQSE